MMKSTNFYAFLLSHNQKYHQCSQSVNSRFDESIIIDEEGEGILKG